MKEILVLFNFNNVNNLFDLHDPLDAFGLNEQCNRIKLCHFQTLYSVTAYVQYAMFALVGHLAHRLHTCAVQIAVELARLNEQMILNVAFHLFARVNKVVVAAVYLVLFSNSSCVFINKKIYLFIIVIIRP